MGTTTDKLNRLIETKEGIRQEINRIYGAEEVSTSDTFNSYIQKLEENPLQLLRCIERKIGSVKVSNVTSLGNSAFRGCKILTSVSFPNVTSIGDNVFNDCTNLTSIYFPNVTSIGINAFKFCTGFTTVSFPKLTSIAEGSTSWMGKKGAFMDCRNLATLYIGTESSTVCTLGTGAFQNCYKLSSIYVPASLVDSYKSATNWSDYADRIKAAP